MSKVITKWAFNFFYKRWDDIIRVILDSCIIPLFSCISSHDSFVWNTLSKLMTKIMTWETFSTKEEIYVIIESSCVVYLLNGFFVVVHPWIGANIIYLWNSFILLLRTKAFLTRFYCIIEALLTDFCCIIELCWLFSLHY